MMTLPTLRLFPVTLLSLIVFGAMVEEMEFTPSTSRLSGVKLLGLTVLSPLPVIRISISPIKKTHFRNQIDSTFLLIFVVFGY